MRKPIKCEDCGEKGVPEWDPCDGEWRCANCYAPSPEWYWASPDRHVPIECGC